LLPKFVSEGAAMYHELRKRGTREELALCLALEPIEPRPGASP
jgi:hypothetical protein